ncbi:MAG: cupin domain-containing protein [Myxococcales bacterium]|nr:cupin domain-containing protein [Myxococcota bacterium]MDW8280594.1 cupin domain-containing protein [Myxococcales bacterium]
MSGPWFDLAGSAAFSAEKLHKVPLCQSPRLLCDIYCLLPGQEQRTHAHQDIDKLYVVLSGRPTVVLGEEARALGPSQGAFAAAGVPHGVRNEAAEPATLLVVQARGQSGA